MQRLLQRVRAVSERVGDPASGSAGWTLTASRCSSNEARLPPHERERWLRWTAGLHSANEQALTQWPVVTCRASPAEGTGQRGLRERLRDRPSEGPTAPRKRLLGTAAQGHRAGVYAPRCPPAQRTPATLVGAS